MRVILLGSTGLVGDRILNELVLNDAVKQITTIGRRAPKISSEKINAIIEKDTSNWYKDEYFKGNDIAISAFGTTKADAGGIEKFKEIDYGNNLKFAQTAKADGIKQFILISSMLANSKSFFPYLKIKGELEDKIEALDFDSTVIFRPGMLLGDREQKRTLESIGKYVVTLPVISKLLGSNDATVIAKKVTSVLGSGEKYKILEQKEINQ